MNLKRRLELMERKVRPGELSAVIEGHFDNDPDNFVPVPLVEEGDPRLQEGVDRNGEALLSRWWFVWFLEGTKDQQESRLKQSRLAPEYQQPWKDGGIPIRYEGGATYEDALFHVIDSEEHENLLLPPTS